jgi:hypothetical protein
MIAVADSRIDWRQTLDIEGCLQRNPYGLLAGALAVGFVLGGGLFTRLMAKMVGAGLRMGVMAALPVIQQKLVEQIKGE